ncbi:hypothetical protein C8R46DRAFT_1081380 [Mycena filopes]|nr:hypothetical protein C8R46DRAFT_1081380 [Mycena filopes]
MSPPAVVVLEYVGCRTRARGLQWTHKDPSVRLNSIALIVPKTKKTISLRCHRSRSARRSQRLRERHEVIGSVPNGGGRSGTTKCSSARSCTTGVCVRAAIVSRKLLAQVTVNCYIPVLKSGGEQQTPSQSIDSVFSHVQQNLIWLLSRSLRNFDPEQAVRVPVGVQKIANFGELEYLVGCEPSVL